MGGETTDTCRMLLLYAAGSAIRVDWFELIVGPFMVTKAPPFTRLASTTVMECPSQPVCNRVSPM